MTVLGRGGRRDRLTDSMILPENLTSLSFVPSFVDTIRVGEGGEKKQWLRHRPYFPVLQCLQVNGRYRQFH